MDIDSFGEPTGPLADFMRARGIPFGSISEHYFDGVNIVLIRPVDIDPSRPLEDFLAFSEGLVIFEQFGLMNVGISVERVCVFEKPRPAFWVELLEQARELRTALQRVEENRLKPKRFVPNDAPSAVELDIKQRHRVQHARHHRPRYADKGR